MREDIAANFAQEDALGTLVEEASIFPQQGECAYPLRA
jgi:hypothetical protein